MPGYQEVQLAVVLGSSPEKLYASHETVFKILRTLPEELTPTSPIELQRKQQRKACLIG